MAENLTNKHIYETYHGLIKTGDNLPIDDTLKVLSDGDGNELPIEVSTDTTKFKEGSTADFTDVTIIGAEGFQGAQGPEGPQGIDGAQGPEGPEGPEGPQGVAGAQGPQGTNGIDGAQGAQGPQGTNGIDGAQGTTGAQGSIGAQGVQGPQGTNGIDGAQGAQGPQGTNGVDGAQGATGAQGIQGPQGDQGAQGTNGISAGKLFYFNESQTSDVAGYKVLADTPVIGAQQTISKTLTGNQQNVLVQQFLTPELGFTVIPAGVQRFKLYYTITPAAADIDAYVTIELADSTGTGYGSIITESPIKIQCNDGQPSETDIDVVFPSAAINATDRIIVKLYLNNLDGVNRTVVWSTEDGYYSYVITSVGVTGNQGPQGPQGFQGSVGGVAINDVTPGDAYTGNTLETIIDTILVPANTVNSGDIFNYLARIGGTKVVSGNTTIRAYVNTVASIGGQALISTGTIIPTTAVQSTINRYFYVNEADGTGLGTQIWNASGPNEGVSSPVNYIQAAIDWTVDQYIVLTGQLFAPTNSVSCPGATFFNTAGARGVQGPQGPGVGDQGPQGPQGPQGLTGSQGVQGPQGIDGTQGPQGIDGAQGAAGPQGVDGAQGFQGPQGPTNPDNIVSTGPNTITSIWEGTQAQYDALGTYDANTIYFIE